jgi:hypothetical protein
MLTTTERETTVSPAVAAEARLVTIPPSTSEQAASAAMRQAAQVGNRAHAPAILAAITPAA